MEVFVGQEVEHVLRLNEHVTQLIKGMSQASEGDKSEENDSSGKHVKQDQMSLSDHTKLNQSISLIFSLPRHVVRLQDLPTLT